MADEFKKGPESMFKPTVEMKTLKLVFAAIGALSILVLTAPIPTVRYLYVGGLGAVVFIFCILFVLVLTDKKDPIVPLGVPLEGPPGEPVTMASKAIWLVPNFFFIAFLAFYMYTCYANSESIQAGTMPENWTLYGWIIYILLLAHLAIVVYGGKYACFSWLTMSFLSVFVAMQFILAEKFKTDG